MRRLLLLRHGNTAWSSERRLCGSTDLPLDERGVALAAATEPAVAAQPVDAAWTSDLVRAVATARAVSPLAARPDPRLRELDFGELEGERFDDLDAATQRAMLAFEGFEAPGGESVEDLRIRVFSFLDELDDGTHLIVTHAGVIRLLLRGSGSDDRLIEPCELVPIDLPSRP